MTEGIDQVRAAIDGAEDIAPMDGQAAPPDPAPRTPSDPPPDPPLGGIDPEDLRQCSLFERNDFGNGQRFRQHFGLDVMFVPRVGWFDWAGTVWQHDQDQLAVRAKAQQLTELIKAEIAHLQIPDWEKDLVERKPELMRRKLELHDIKQDARSKDQRAELRETEDQLGHIAEVEKRLKERRAAHRTFARSSGNSNKIKCALEEASVALAKPFEALDARELDVNTETAVLRFSVKEEAGQSGPVKVASHEELRHDRDQLLTKLLPVAYDPSATCPKFDAFLDRVQPARDMREFLQRFFGLAMTGVQVPYFCFFYGTGANGKSVLTDLLARILGNYAATARIESLTGQNRRGGGEATPDLVPLMGARLVRTSEPEAGLQLQEGLIKALTGGEPMQVRALHSDFVEVYPKFKLVISGNHKPEIRGGDDGIWRRVLLTPFEVKIPEAERDPDLIEKLWAERSGILNWMIEGLLNYLEGGLAPPAQVRDATQEYREESDPVGSFLATCCITSNVGADSITSKDLAQAFTYWQMENGRTPWKPTTISRQLAEKAKTWKHPHTGHGFSHRKASIIRYDGIALVEPFGTRFRNAPRDSKGQILGVSDPDMTEDSAASSQ